MNRDFHKRRGVVGVDDLQSLREELLQLCQLALDGCRRIQRVCTSSELNPQTGCRLPVDFGHHIVVFATQLNASHILQMNH